MPHPLVTRYLSWLMPLLTAIVFFAVFYFLYTELNTIDFRRVVDQAKATPVSQIVLSLALMVLAYLSLTVYEALAVRYVGAVVAYRRVAFTALLAYAVGHNVGLSSLSGGAMRYRMYSLVGLSATQIATVILFGTITFGLGMSLLVGTSLLIEPSTMWGKVAASPILVTTVGVTLLVLTSLYYLWAFWIKRPLQFKQLIINAPSTPIVFGQLFISAADLTLAASVLYVLLPASHDISFFQFLPIFLVAIGLGTMSSIPGGVGVFETVLLLALPALSSENLLSTILVYRVIYYLIPLLIALMGFIVHEVRIHLRKIPGIVEGVGDWLSASAPPLAGSIVFLAGSVLLFSGAIPAIDARIESIRNFLPLSLVELSHLLGSLCGIMLVILSRGLFKRLRGILHLTLFLLFIGIIASLAKGVDYEEALLLLLSMLVLWSARDSFYRSSSLFDESFTPAWIVSVIIISVSIWIGFVSYDYVEYSEKLWWQFAFHADAPRMLRATVVVLIISISFLLWKLLHDAGHEKIRASEVVDFSIIRNIVEHSKNTQSSLAFMGDKLFLLHPYQDAFIMYQHSGNSWVALGDPIGNPERGEELAWSYRTLCDRHNARPVFYQVSEKFLSVFVDMGLSLSKLGEEGHVPLKDFSLKGGGRSDLRQAENRMQKLGAVFEVIPATKTAVIMGELQQISDAWLEDKSAHEKSFSLGAFNLDYLSNFDIAVVKLDGKIIAFVNLLQGADKEELSLDLMRFAKSAPKGVMDFLFVEVILWGKAQGYQFFSLGMAPLSGLENHALAPVWHKIGTFIFNHGESFYNFEGLRAYKEKYDPVWRPRYIATTSGLAMPAALLDTSRLISGGMMKILRKKKTAADIKQ